MGQGQGTESRINCHSQENDVTRRPQANRCCPESSLGEVEEGTKGGLEMSCRQQLKRSPDVVTDLQGVSPLVFECILGGAK